MKGIGHLWLAKLDGSRERTEIKVDGEPRFWCPSISPDGKYITVVIMNLGGAPVNQVFILNRDGTDLRQITTGEDYHWWPTWSPDGRRIFYYTRGFSNQYKSFKIYVVNVPRIEAPRFISFGGGASWSDSVTLTLQDMNTGNMWQEFLDGRPRKKFSEDSISAFPVQGGKYVVFHDEHQSALLAGRPARWCRMEDWVGIGTKSAANIPTMEYFEAAWSAFYLRRESDLYHLSFPDWKLQKVVANIEEIDPVWSANFSTTRDGKEMVYSSVETVNKIGVIENLFK